MKQILSNETLDQAVADLVRRKIQLTQARAAMDAEIAAVQKRHGVTITAVADDICDREAAVAAYCSTHRVSIFGDMKSRETATARFGFRDSPPRVETINKKVRWSDVVDRLQHLVWGERFIRYAEPKPDKEAILAERQSLTPEMLTAAGVRIVQDQDCWFLDAKPETAAE